MIGLWLTSVDLVVLSLFLSLSLSLCGCALMAACLYTMCVCGATVPWRTACLCARVYMFGYSVVVRLCLWRAACSYIMCVCHSVYVVMGMA